MADSGILFPLILGATMQQVIIQHDMIVHSSNNTLVGVVRVESY